MYIIVLGDNGQDVARRHIDASRVAEWLQRNGPGSSYCEVYTDVPEKGGTRIAILRRNPQNGLWGLAAER